MKQKYRQFSGFSRGMVAAAILFAACASGDDGDLPPVQHSGDISFCSGGVGADEISAMKAAAAKYPLALTFVSHIGDHDAYTAPDEVTILKSDGAPVLDIKPDGPLLLIDLPAGTYRITAGSAQQSRTQAVRIVHGAHKRLVFELANPDQTSSP